MQCNDNLGAMAEMAFSLARISGISPYDRLQWNHGTHLITCKLGTEHLLEPDRQRPSVKAAQQAVPEPPNICKEMDVTHHNGNELSILHLPETNCLDFLLTSHKMPSGAHSKVQ